MICSQKSFGQIEFIQNKGQWHNNVQYKAEVSAGSLYLEKSGFTILLQNADDVKMFTEMVHGNETATRPFPDKFTLHSFAYKVKFLNASASPFIQPDKPFEFVNNYFIGNNQAQWASDCKVFQAITYKNVYPNIDIRYYSSSGNLKYDFIVRPGGNPKAITLQYDGPKLAIKNKNLVITTPVGEVKELYPYSYQSYDGKPKEVASEFVLKENTVSIAIKEYNPMETLIIDPSIIFSTFSGSTAQNWGYTATPGPDGSLYGGGIVFGSGYPVSSGAYDQTYNGGPDEGSFGGYDIGISKFGATNGLKLFSTYIGGSGNEQPHSLIADDAGNLYIAGRSSSANFPLAGGGAQQGIGGKYDIIVAKLNATGSVLLGSTKIGGSQDDGVNIRPKYVGPNVAVSLRRNYGDDARSEIILDRSGNAYLASCTQSGDFPVSSSPIQTTFGGVQDGVILKFNNNLTSIIFSTYFGGSLDDACFVCNLNPFTGNLYVGGATASNNLPGNKSGVIQPSFQGGIADGFVTEIKNDGSAIIKTSYFGTSGIDLIYGLKFDRKGFPYIMGTTTGSWPVVNAAYSNPGSKQFIAKLQPDLAAYVYSTIFGTSIAQPNISPIAFLVDRCENVYVSGWGGGINGSYSPGTTQGLPETNPLNGIPIPDGKDFYFFVLEKNAQSRLFASHFGRNGGLGEHVDGGTSRFDANGVIYQAICGECDGSAGFPITAGASSCRDNGGYNLAVIKIEMNFSGVGSKVEAAVDGVANDTIICVGGRVDFKDLVLKGKKYYWDFNDSPNRFDTTTAPSNFHIFSTAGSHRVMLIAEDSSTCNVRDTSYVTIKVGTNAAQAAFSWVKLPPCQNLSFQFSNTSTSVGNSFSPQTFYWDFGDGSPVVVTDYVTAPQHTYAATGDYTVILTIKDTLFCNSPVADTQRISVSDLVDANFSVPDVGCAPFTASFINLSHGGLTYLWQYGDGQFSTNADAVHTHIYSTPGVYRVRLIAANPNTCNMVDTSAYFTITVLNGPVANASWSPNPPVVNMPTNFTNLSTGAVSFLWNFGDGASSTAIHPSYQYNATQTFSAALIAYNNIGCTDTFFLFPRALILPALDVPNAFTPGKFGINSSINVVGFGIGKMDWKIYNRWGQLVFQSASNKQQGWDGTFKGKPQPMDVYTYTLDVIFTDGKTLRKTGDITLIR